MRVILIKIAFRHIASLFDFVFIYETNIFCSFINFFCELINTYLSQKAAQDALLFGCSGWSGSSSFSFYSFHRIFHSASWCFWGGTCTSSCKDKNIYSAVLKISKYLQSNGQIKPNADWRAIDSPKKRTNEFGVFAMTVRNTYLKLEILISSFKYIRTVKQK